MNYREFLQQKEKDREGVFVESAQKLGTSANNVEKDFWICFLLDAVFMDGSKRWPELVFRGGTSLSKAHNAIKRFSEDIDLGLSRRELGITETVNSLHALSESERGKRLIKLDAAGQEFVASKMVPHLNKYFDQQFKGIRSTWRPDIMQDDQDALTLLIPYQSVTREAGGYIPKRVRLEFSIKSALKPNTGRSFSPYIANILPDPRMNLTRIPTISVARTFWDKVMIAHELKDRHSKGLRLTANNERVSRHYYDLYTLITTNRVSVNKTQIKLAADCQKHSAAFYPDPAIDLSDALPGTLDIVPDDEMVSKLSGDYNEMAVMIFGEAPSLEDIRRELSKFEERVNRFHADNPASPD